VAATATDTRARDLRRMETLRAILRDGSGASASEVQQAKERLAELEQRHGAGAGTGPTWREPWPWERPWESRRSGWTPPDPAEQERRRREAEEQTRRWAEQAEARRAAEAERLRRKVVEKQRAKIEAVPFWHRDYELVALHAFDRAWTEDEENRVESCIAQVRDTKAMSPDASGRAIVAIGKVWGAERTEAETRWLGEELARIAKFGKMCRLTRGWLEERGAAL
jgi:hypothetical protein